MKWSTASEFRADVELVSARNLSEIERVIFADWYLAGIPWAVVSKRVGLDKGNFFHAVYAIEARLGMVFAELTPYALYPVDEYFLRVVKRVDQSNAGPVIGGRKPIRPPLSGGIKCSNGTVCAFP